MIKWWNSHSPMWRYRWGMLGYALLIGLLAIPLASLGLAALSIVVLGAGLTLPEFYYSWKKQEDWDSGKNVEIKIAGTVPQPPTNAGSNGPLVF